MPTPNSNETTMNLTNDVTINGQVFKAGQNVAVPKEQAEDIARIDYEHQKYKDTLHTKRTFEVNGGTMSVGGGAE